MARIAKSTIIDDFNRQWFAVFFKQDYLNKDKPNHIFDHRYVDVSIAR